MDISFAHRDLAKCCNDFRLLKRRFGDRQAKKIMQRLEVLRAASCLADIGIRGMPPYRCHELFGDRAGELSIDVVHPYRLIFGPDYDPVPRTENGELDWKRITAIKIFEVVDTHD